VINLMRQLTVKNGWQEKHVQEKTGQETPDVVIGVSQRSGWLCC
jgi:hypothetical protein